MKKIIVLFLVLLLFGSMHAVVADNVKAEEAIFAGGWPYSVPPTGHFNMFASNGITLKFYRGIHQLPLAYYIWAESEFEPYLATDWDIDKESNVMTVHLREEAKWLNGDNFTADDVWTTFMIKKMMGDSVWDYLEEMTIEDRYTMSFKFNEGSTLIKRYILRSNIVDYATYGSFAEKAEDLIANGKDDKSEEWQNLLEDFNEFRPDFVNATGPFYLNPDKVSQSKVVFEKNPNSYLKDVVKFDKLFVYNGDVSELTPLVLNEEIDYLTHVFPAGTMETFESMGIKSIKLSGRDGIALYFNHAEEPLDKRKVRKAIAYIVDREEVGKLAVPGVTKGVEYITGVGKTMTQTWVKNNDGLEPYNPSPEKAKSLLKEVGLTEKNGAWYVGDEKFTLKLQAPTGWSDAATAAKNISEQLTAFGIKTTFKGIDSSQRVPNINKGDFELALSFWGTGQPHPKFAYEGPLLYSNIKADGPGIGFDMIQDTSLGKVNFEELIEKSAQGWDLNKQKEIVTKIAHGFNETLPILPIYTKESKNVTGAGIRSEWPDFDDPIYNNPPGVDNFAVISILRGDLKPIK